MNGTEFARDQVCRFFNAFHRQDRLPRASVIRHLAQHFADCKAAPGERRIMPRDPNDLVGIENVLRAEANGVVRRSQHAKHSALMRCDAMIEFWIWLMAHLKELRCAIGSAVRPCILPRRQSRAK